MVQMNHRRGLYGTKEQRKSACSRIYHTSSFHTYEKKGFSVYKSIGIGDNGWSQSQFLLPQL